MEAEGGCGVIGLASQKKVAGRHLLPALCQMENRGNGKGGGIAAVGMVPEAFGVTQQILEQDYLLAIAYLDLKCRSEIEKSLERVDHIYEMPFRDIGLEVQPPSVVLYFLKGTDAQIYQHSDLLNRQFYQTTGEKRAFVLSHGKNLLVLKLVGYGQDVIHTYQLEDFYAHVWIGHHRYPTTGRIWHPGGAHPFVGMNEALVHNGDFANYFSLCEYLKQRGIVPHFLTDTEVAALLFDLLHRMEGYSLEQVIEILAPTTERDFTLLSEEKQKEYRELQQSHIHGSPDGPWFFLVAQSLPQVHRLIGITDTSMLRPQVFALGEGIGFAASEKQAIDATLQSIAKEDSSYCPCPDYIWNARGGSHTDGGAFSFSVYGDRFVCEDKFGREMYPEPLPSPTKLELETTDIRQLTRLLDQPLKNLRQSHTRAILSKKLNEIFATVHLPDVCRIDAHQLAAEGEGSLARLLVEMHQKGFYRFILFNCQGQRFIGSGLGPNSDGVEIHVYGSSGDYLASGIDGAEIHVHGHAQDQLAQIMNSGTLVVHGNVGQAFMYGAKGGKAFVRGNTAGRPLINAVGHPRVIINGTCLDYLAESFMAGNPLKGGGFVVVNSLYTSQNGEWCDFEDPYPGSNLFSLPSGGAIYIRDPEHKVTKGQLNGGEFVDVTVQDWELLLPYLEENNRHFDLTVERLLQYREKAFAFHQIYRKINPILARAVLDEEAWVKGGLEAKR